MNATLLALAVTGATYTIQWDLDDFNPLHLTGVVDTQTDTLTWDWLPEGLGSLVWPAVTRGEQIPSGEGHWEIAAYDVPDDWSGVMDEWGFLSDFKWTRYNYTHYPGLGCTEVQWLCIDLIDFCNGQTLGFSRTPSSPRWTVTEIQGVPPDLSVYGVLGPALVDIQPVSPTRIVGDVNWDGAFNSSDLVQVFTMGKYQTDQPAIWMEGDWDQNGLFDSGDMVAAFAAGDYERPVAAVPEPSAVLLLCLGVVLGRRLFRLKD